MTEVIEDTIIGARAQLEENEITLNMRIPDDLPPVEADPDSVRQIMSNLLGNAIKSTPAGGAIEISTQIYDQNGDAPAEDIAPFLMISIKDSGGGIAQKDVERVFDRFYRVDQHHVSEGAGLGLAITKKILELHGSKIDVHSRLNAGTTLTFELPAYSS